MSKANFAQNASSPKPDELFSLHAGGCGRSRGNLESKEGMVAVISANRNVQLLLLLAGVGLVPTLRAEDATMVERRLSRTATYLADDRLAGRGLGSPEIELAAEFIAQQFTQMGLAAQFQTFTYVEQAEQGSDCQAVVVHPTRGTRQIWKVDEDFRPLAVGNAGQLRTQLVFAGYGITAPDLGYDDYAGLDVRGKTVVVLRHEPQQGDPQSAFNGTDDSEHAPFRRKIKNAIDHGAAAIVFCTSRFEVERRKAQWQRARDSVLETISDDTKRFEALGTASPREVAKHRRKTHVLADQAERFAANIRSETNALLPFEGAGRATSDERLPVLFASRRAIDGLLAAAGRPSLDALEAKIDTEARPASFPLGRWQLVANVDLRRQEVAIRNVVGVLQGEGPLADETVVVGAHYDHLGRGSQPDVHGEIHNGADDNASGVSMLMELAGYYANRPTPPARRMLFVAFTGEELGLLGSAHYVAQPVVPLESTVAMFNFDMVGRLVDNRLILSGTETASEFSDLVDDINERHGFDLVKVPGGLGPSDHASFCSKQIPVLHFFTGLHNDYHRPSDDVALLNLEGMTRVYQYAQQVIDEVMESPARPEFTQTDGPSRPL